MSTRHLVDPELAALLEVMPGMDFTAKGIDQVRAQMAERRASFPVPAGLPENQTEHTIPGPAGSPDVKVLVYQPLKATGPFPAILHVHGGGYVLGDASMNEIKHRLLTEQLGCVIVSVDYRLSPETAHPGPVEDCYAGLAWLYENAGKLNVDRKRIGVMGESAGGGLAAGLALVARDRGEIPLAFQHLIFPMLDDRTCTDADPHPFVGEFIWGPDQNRFGWAALLGVDPGAADVHYHAAPARAPDLTGLPPTFISVGALDLFLEEDLEYARRLSRVGVPVELHVYPGAYHGYHAAVEARVTKQADRDSLEALRRSMHG